MAAGFGCAGAWLQHGAVSGVGMRKLSHKWARQDHARLKDVERSFVIICLLGISKRYETILRKNRGSYGKNKTFDSVAEYLQIEALKHLNECDQSVQPRR